jgi:hypothetical protein
VPSNARGGSSTPTPRAPRSPASPAPSACSTGGSFDTGDVRWFADGQLNVSYNCLDRHVKAGRGDDVAILFEGDEPGDVRRYTYSQALAQVCRVANVLTYHGVRRGDTVAVYMPMVPDLAFVMLVRAPGRACGGGGGGAVWGSVWSMGCGCRPAGCARCRRRLG